ncbi:MAG: DNA mismatch repair endonuclease MutL [Planctomycetes bacterium]|nr:DNA mismatch repair endonuclease MutL [Planctomycetota bacterium]
MGQIQILSAEVANTIAAGEVVERPCSVVKELVENAIDAGAEQITVELTDGGKTLIRVTDDGSGMDREDLLLSLQAHATSKLRTAKDLFAVTSNGFRGEALASIQSVSRVSIITRQAGDEFALRLDSDGGEIGDIRESAGSYGTTIEVGDLFYNIPARRRWLKSDSAEFSRIIENMQALAASNPEIGFRLVHGSRKAIDLPPQQPVPARIQDLYGDKFKDGMLELHDHEAYCRIDGFISPPGQNRPNSKGLKLFVNRRPITDRSLMQAVILAYREFLPPGRYPLAVLFLTVPQDSIDVNVHPAKTEVRLLEQNRIFAQIKAALTEKLLNSGVLPSIKLGAALNPKPHYGGHGIPTTQAPQARPDSAFEPRHDIETPSIFDSQSEVQARDAANRWDAARSVLTDAASLPVANQEISGPVAIAGAEHGVENYTPEVGDVDLRDSEVTAPQSLLQRARGLFQVGSTYIIVETEQGMVMIDQHAFHERILYWLLENRFQSNPLERQKLLVPMPLDLSREALALVGEHTDVLKEFGFELTETKDGWGLTAVPKYSINRHHTEVIVEILEELAQGRVPPTPDSLRKHLVETVACKAAIKAGDTLTPEQIKNLLILGESVPHTFSCPHGRPTTYELGFYALEKIFHRR